MQIELRPTDSLVEYSRNPRKNDHVVEKMVSAIREFGFRIPIVAKSDGTVVDGHLRLKAARQMGLEEVPVVLADDLTDAQIKAFRLLANRSASWADWDNELLRLEFDELQELGFDLEMTGFSDGEITGLFLEIEEGETDAEAEWEGMPEFEDQDPCFRKVIVNFDTPEDVAEFFSLIGQSYTDRTKSIWFPEKERRDLESMRWVSDGEG